MKSSGRYKKYVEIYPENAAALSLAGKVEAIRE